MKPTRSIEPSVASRRWALGQSEIPEAVAMLLRLMVRLRLKPEQLTEKEFDGIIKLGCARERSGGSYLVGFTPGSDS